VYLTNSLEEYHPDTGTLFAGWLSDEANEANRVKRDTPVMVVLGNPPYSGISSNNGEWISNLINEYKYIDGEYFNERKHWLNDDYVKFIRFGEYFIEKNGSGILAFINPHGFLDNPTFRGMRWHLLKTFDKIYTMDLHGNSKKKETAPDGTGDENVFDIMQGVSINLFIKNGKKKENSLGEIFHFDLFGKREIKYGFLSEYCMKSINYSSLVPQKPYVFFIPKNDAGQQDYENGFKIAELFPTNVSGIVTMGDEFAISESKEDLHDKLKEFKAIPISENELKTKYNLGKNYAEFILKNKNQLVIDYSKFVRFSYRPFDNRWTYFDNKIIWRWRQEVMQHLLDGRNIGIVVSRQCVSDWQYVFVTKFINEFNLTGTAGRFGSGYTFPLYLINNAQNQQSIDNSLERIPNLKIEIVSQIATNLNLHFTNEKEDTPGTFAPIDILDYIYAVLHSPTYRAKYKEFLKIDFPRVPYPENAEQFWALVKLGGELRQLHLLESLKVNDYITQYPVAGDNVVDKPKYEAGRVYINDTQYFDNVPEVAWNFYIGGYQPAQKWLKDRKGRTLSFDDILHYQRIIIALHETERVMEEVDGVMG